MHNSDPQSENGMFWAYSDENFYSFMRNKYSNRANLAKEADDKRKALEKMKDDNPLYHRMAAGAEMAQLRLDMAYIIDKNTKLEQFIETIGYLHQRVDILEGAYGHLKLLFETCKIQATLCNSKPAKEKP